MKKLFLLVFFLVVTHFNCWTSNNRTSSNISYLAVIPDDLKKEILGRLIDTIGTANNEKKAYNTYKQVMRLQRLNKNYNKIFKSKEIKDRLRLALQAQKRRLVENLKKERTENALIKKKKSKREMELKLLIPQFNPENLQELYLLSLKDTSSFLPIILVLLGMDVNAELPGYTRPLHKAILHNHQDLVLLLLSKGANPNLGANRIAEWSALHVAAKNNNLELVKILLESGANPRIKSGKIKIPQYYATDQKIKKLLEPLKGYSISPKGLIIEPVD